MCFAIRGSSRSHMRGGLFSLSDLRPTVTNRLDQSPPSRAPMICAPAQKVLSFFELSPFGRDEMTLVLVRVFLS